MINGKFPITLKNANVTPVHKKDDPTDKTNFRPISVLPLLSKVFERVIYKQLGKYVDTFLNKLLCGFRKAHCTQHALFKLLQRWQNELDNSGLVGTILMDHSKAYDCLPHDLIIAKFEAYGVSKSSLSLLLDYLIFNLDLSNILENLKHDLKILLKWFRKNSLQAGKFQFMIFGKKKRNSVKLIINTTETEESRKVVLLGITIDNLLIFNEYIDNLCRAANYKLHALRRIRKYLSLEKAKLLYNAFINSQFNYAPLVWMFYRKKQYLKIQKIHHKALKVVYNSNKNYDELLRNNNEVSIHQSHLRALICVIFKSLNNLNPEFMWPYFVFKNITYSVRKGPLLRLSAAKSTSYGINSALFRACLLWKSLPQSIKYSESIVELKTKMKDLGNINCSCILCR